MVEAFLDLHIWCERGISEWAIQCSGALLAAFENWKPLLRCWMSFECSPVPLSKGMLRYETLTQLQICSSLSWECLTLLDQSLQNKAQDLDRDEETNSLRQTASSQRIPTPFTSRSPRHALLLEYKEPNAYSDKLAYSEWQRTTFIHAILWDVALVHLCIQFAWGSSVGAYEN